MLGTRFISIKDWRGLSRFIFDELMKTSDAIEGIAAHMERRRPVWSGK